MELALWFQSLPLDRILTTTFLVLARLAPVVFLVPFLGGPKLSTMARLVVAVALGMACWPSAWMTLGPSATGNWVLEALLVLKETLVGTTLALMVWTLFAAFQSAGKIIDLVRGSQMASSSSVQTQDPSSPTGLFLLMFAVVIFVSIGGHDLVIAALAHSYEVIPAGRWPTIHGWRQTAWWAIWVGREFFFVAVGLATPVLAAGFLVDLAFGLLGRLAPQLPSYFMSLPVKAWTGVLLLLLAFPLIIHQIWRLSEETAALLTRVIGAFAAGMG